MGLALKVGERIHLAADNIQFRVLRDGIVGQLGEACQLLSFDGARQIKGFEAAATRPEYSAPLSRATLQ